MFIAAQKMYFSHSFRRGVYIGSVCVIDWECDLGDPLIHASYDMAHLGELSVVH